MPHDVIRPDWSYWQWPPTKADWDKLRRQEAEYQARRAVDPLKGGPIEQFLAWLLCVP